MKVTLKGKAQDYSLKNWSVPARNLGRSELGAVIFGCKNYTFQECHNRLLFGLPSPHHAYVKNIAPGLPLFLFNYSDRSLHGIYEAASPGQINIDRHAWIDDGSVDTPYPAQVRVRIKMQCQPLSEAQFQPIIAENYYEYKLFYFELDQAQTKKLISLFSSSPIAGNTSLSQNISRLRTTGITTQIGADIMASHPEVYTGHTYQSNIHWDAPDLCRESQNLEAPVVADTAGKYEQSLAHQKPIAELSYSSVVSNTSASLPQKSWSSLFKTSTSSDTSKENDFNAPSSGLTVPNSGQSNVVRVSSCAAPHWDGENLYLQAHVDELVVEKHDQEHFGDTRQEEDYPERMESDWNLPHPDESNVGWDSFTTHHLDGEIQPPEASPLTEATASVPSCASLESLASADTRLVEEYPKRMESDWNLPHSDDSFALLHLDGHSQPSEASTSSNSTKVHKEELLQLKPPSDCFYPSTAAKEPSVDENYWKTHAPAMAGIHSEDRCLSEAVVVLGVKSSYTRSVLDMLIEQIEALKSSQLKQILKISSLEKEQERSRREIQELKNKYSALLDVMIEMQTNESSRSI